MQIHLQIFNLWSSTRDAMSTQFCSNRILSGRNSIIQTYNLLILLITISSLKICFIQRCECWGAEAEEDIHVSMCSDGTHSHIWAAFVCCYQEREMNGSGWDSCSVLCRKNTKTEGEHQLIFFVIRQSISSREIRTEKWKKYNRSMSFCSLYLSSQILVQGKWHTEPEIKSKRLFNIRMTSHQNFVVN